MLINEIQNKILELEGGAFQKLVDTYLYKKYGYTNIQTLGVQIGTSKPTKGIPDSYVSKNDKYILIMYGSVKRGAYEKIKKDILDCLNLGISKFGEEKIEKIICVYTNNNLHIDQFEELRSLSNGIPVFLIGIETISQDLYLKYPKIAHDFLGVNPDTHQIFDIEDFIEIYEATCVSGPLNLQLIARKKEKEEIIKGVENHKITIITGPSGVGKTRLGIEVCKDFEKKGIKVYCIRQNGLELYEDLSNYVSEPANYLIFIDDINHLNNLRSILLYTQNIPQKNRIRFLFTVRDYAKVQVINILQELYEYSENCTEKRIDILEDNQIREILEDDLLIVNPHFIEKIVSISKGNPRLAVMAGIKSIDKGFSEIRDATDIFRNYYGDFEINRKLSRTEIIVLFTLSSSQPVDTEKDVFSRKILEFFNIADEEYKETLRKLNNSEHIEWFKERAAKISDQSFGDYIIEYVLFTKKIISISKLLEICFPVCKRNVIYSISTLVNLFPSDDLQEYVKEEINKCWNSSTETTEVEYVKSFHALNNDKALRWCIERIREENTKNCKLFETGTNKVHAPEIIIDTLNVLVNIYYYTENAEIIELILDLFGKRPDYVSDITDAIANGIIYIDGFWENKYKREISIVNTLIRYINTSGNENYYYLYFDIAEVIMMCEHLKTRESRKNNSVSLLKIHLIPTPELFALRRLIFETIIKNPNASKHSKKVYSFLQKNYYVGYDHKDDILQIFSNDFEIIFDLLCNNIAIPSFEICEVLSTFEESGKWLGASIASKAQIYNQNESFRIYKTLRKVQDYKYSWQNENEYQDYYEEFKQMLFCFDENHIRKIIKICKNREEINNPVDRRLGSAIGHIFTLSEDKIEQYVKLVNIYIDEGCPYGNYPQNIINYLLRNIGYEETIAITNKYEFSTRWIWKEQIWESIDDTEINLNVAKDYLSFLQDASREKIIIPITFINACRYEKFIPGFIVETSKLLFNYGTITGRIISTFLGYSIDENNAFLILSTFKNDMGLLKLLYLCGDMELDNEFVLFFDILNVEKEFLYDYLQTLKNNSIRTEHLKSLFKKIWKNENFEMWMNDVYNELIKSRSLLEIDYYANCIFGNKGKDTITRIKNWIIQKITEEVNCVTGINQMLTIVNSIFPEWRIEIINKICELNHDLDVFTGLSLFPVIESFTGSEIPTIDKKISFLLNLKDSLQSICFVEHRLYLEERIKELRKRKEVIEINEYLGY